MNYTLPSVASAQDDRGIDSMRIFVDVTGIVRWGAQPAVGIIRTEQSVCEYALGVPDVGFVIFDSIQGTMKKCSDREMQFVAFIIESSRQSVPMTRRDKILRSTRFLREQIVYQDNETSRRLAALLTGRERRGVLYQTAKTAIRLGMWLAAVPRLPQMALRKLGLGYANKAPNAIVLMSHEINRHPCVVKALRSFGGMGAHIVYDLIPILHPELTGPRFSRTMEGLFRRILVAQEPIITISRAVRDDMIRWNEAVVHANYPLEIAVCQLGSVMPAENADETPIAELVGKNFVVYCSSIEKRKNQDFLVTLWRELARTISSDLLPDLVLIGRKTTGWEALQTELAASPPDLRNKVHVLRGIADPQLRWAYRNAKFGVFPSSAEGWGLGVSECLAYNLPVVISDLAVLDEVSQGLMPRAAVRNLEAWDHQVRRLIIDPEALDDLRRTINEHYRPISSSGFAACVIGRLRQFIENRTAVAA